MPKLSPAPAVSPSRCTPWLSAALLITALLTDSARADTVERSWELGVGLGAVSAPDYRGSRSYRHYIAPVPYAVYRGRFLRIDRDGLQGDFFRRERLELNISASATVTPESHRNPLREGMPAIYSTGELGPSLNINLTEATFDAGWHLSLPLRAVISAGNGKPKAIGWVFNPQLVYRREYQGWGTTYRTGPVYASGRYHDHYYGVAERYATDTRPAFDTGGGYSGWHQQLASSRRISHWWYGFFIRHDALHQARFVDSPLVESRTSVTLGAAASRVFF